MNFANNYLENFWVPKQGDCIIFDNKKFTINSVDDKFNTQALVQEDPSLVIHLQDAHWFITVAEGIEIIKNIGIGVDEKNKQLFGFRSFFKYPESIEEVVEAIKYFRHLSILNGKDLL